VTTRRLGQKELAHVVAVAQVCHSTRDGTDADGDHLPPMAARSLHGVAQVVIVLVGVDRPASGCFPLGGLNRRTDSNWALFSGGQRPGWTRMDIKADTISAKMDTNGHQEWTQVT
jgi:hypothetical protein